MAPHGWRQRREGIVPRPVAHRRWVTRLSSLGQQGLVSQQHRQQAALSAPPSQQLEPALLLLLQLQLQLQLQEH